MTLQISTPGTFSIPGLPDLGVQGFSDTFSRPDAITLGHTEKPRRLWTLWPAETAEGGVIGGQGYLRSTTVAARRFAYADARAGDAAVEMTLASIDTGLSVNQFGVAARASSERNAWLFYAHSTTEYRLSSLINNNMTDVQVVTAVTPTAGARLRLEVSGGQIRAFVDGTLRASTENDAMSTNTLFGIFSNSTSTANRGDDIAVTPLT